MIFLCGVGGALVGLWGYFSPAIRDADETLPDYKLPPPVGLVRHEQPFPPTEKPMAGLVKEPARTLGGGPTHTRKK
jgi:hypothetical protein